MRLEEEKEFKLYEDYLELINEQNKPSLLENVMATEETLCKLFINKIINKSDLERIEIYKRILLILGWCDLVYESYLDCSIYSILVGIDSTELTYEKTQTQCLSTTLDKGYLLINISLRLFKSSSNIDSLDTWFQMYLKKYRPIIRELVLINRKY